MNIGRLTIAWLWNSVYKGLAVEWHPRTGPWRSILNLVHTERGAKARGW